MKQRLTVQEKLNIIRQLTKGPLEKLEQAVRELRYKTSKELYDIVYKEQLAWVKKRKLTQTELVKYMATITAINLGKGSTTISLAAVVPYVKETSTDRLKLENRRLLNWAAVTIMIFEKPVVYWRTQSKYDEATTNVVLENLVLQINHLCKEYCEFFDAVYATVMSCKNSQLLIETLPQTKKHIPAKPKECGALVPVATMTKVMDILDNGFTPTHAPPKALKGAARRAALAKDKQK